MKRITLFSTLNDSNEETILGQILPMELAEKVIAYMPSEGVEDAQEYIKQWQGISKKYNAKLNVINNGVQSLEEQNKLLSSNILVISGGNTFNLLNNLRESGLDKSIKLFIDKPDFVISGFSAGAIVLTPNINMCNLPDFDENLIGLEDLGSLGIVDFEIFPHYKKEIHEKILNDYRELTANRVYEITDEDYITIDL